MLSWAWSVLWAAVLSILSVPAALSASGCSQLLDFGFAAGSPGNDSGVLLLGAACNEGTHCASGFCADGVCCNNACAGTCESCNQGGRAGTCWPIAAHTDPERECVMVAPPVVDAGAVDAGGDAAASDVAASDVAASDAAASDAAASDAGAAASVEGGVAAGDTGAAEAAAIDAATQAGPSLGYNPPDGGVTTDDTKCAGSCDGKGGNGGGACVYPDSTTVCGTQFCNTSEQGASFVCDSAGHCGLSLSKCKDYACSSATGTCNSSCLMHTDCLPTDYCDSPNCRPRRGNGVSCAGPNGQNEPSECMSGFCDDSVCCDTDCSMTPDGHCNLTAAKAGQCSCSACPDGPCAVYYFDGDGDGYGDSTKPMVACAGAPPAHYVTNNTDCDDGDARVNPAQTAYFDTANNLGSFDYNCDNSLEKGIPEYPSYVVPSDCGFCGTPQSTSPACSIASYACSASGDQSTLGCSEYFGFPGLAATTASSGVTTLAAPINICAACPMYISVSYCGPSPTPDRTAWQKYPGSGFAGITNCGDMGTFIYCGTCSSNTGSPYSSTLMIKQTCH